MPRWDEVFSKPWKCHLMSSGRSPFDTWQLSWTDSPAKTDSSASKGTMYGNTVNPESQVRMINIDYMCKRATCGRGELYQHWVCEVPWTLTVVEWTARPALFEAWHEYSPLWLAVALGIVSRDVRWPIFVVVMPSWEDNSFPWKLQVIARGTSPLDTWHVNCTDSPANTGSSASNWTMCGGTGRENKQT